MRVMTAEQWRAQGISTQLLRSLTRSGDLVQLRRGVYATKSAVKWAESDRVRRHALHVLAARATAGRDAVASYQSAAMLHKLDLLKSPPVGRVTLTVPPSRRWERAHSADMVFHSAVPHPRPLPPPSPSPFARPAPPRPAPSACPRLCASAPLRLCAPAPRARRPRARRPRAPAPRPAPRALRLAPSACPRRRRALALAPCALRLALPRRP
jgi:hypothetical protein